MGLFDSIWSAGESFLGGNDSPIGGLISNVVEVAGKDGWDGIVDQVSNADSGLWGSVVDVAKSELGQEYSGLIDGIKGAVDGDTDAVFGSVIGGVRDYVGVERFDSIATTVGEAVNGETDGWWDELSEHVTEAVGNDTFTAIVDGVNSMGGSQYGDDLLGSVLTEVQETVGDDAWGYFENAAGIHAELVDETVDQADAASADATDDDVAIGDVFDDDAIDPLEQDGADAESDEFGETIDPFADATDASTPGSPFGDTPLEDILEPSPAGDGPSSPFGDTPLEDILEPTPGAGIAADEVPDSPFGDAPLDDILEMAPGTGYVPDFQMGTGFPGGDPLPGGDQELILTAPAPVDQAQAPIEAEPVTELQADIATAESYTAQVDTFFDDIDQPSAPAELDEVV